MNAPDPPHWTLNSCFGAFRTIWVHLGPLECLTKLGAKRAERANVRATKSRQNFLQRTHSIRPIGPQTDVLVHFVRFGCIRDRLVALRNSVQNGPY